MTGLGSVSWHSFDLRSGRRGGRLVTAERGSFGRIIGEATETQLSVRCWDPVAGALDWDAGTLPGRTMLVAVCDETEEPLWGGMVVRRVSDESEWVSVTAVTLEHYLDRRYVGDLSFDGDDQATIAAGIIDDIAVDGLAFTVDAPATGVNRDRTYRDDEDKTALSLLTDLAEIENGIEFTVELRWADDTKTLLERVFVVRSRIGTAKTVPVQFTMPGCVTGFEFVEDYTAEWGANEVVATSSGEGDARPESTPQVDQGLLDLGWARFERRVQPSTSITSKSVLNAHAAEELSYVRGGLTQLSLEAHLDSAPRLFADWWLGDDITAVLSCPRFPERVGPDGDTVPGYERRTRAVGWTVDLDARTLTPNLREV